MQIRIIRKADEIGNPDCIIIPGSKSTIADLQHLKNSGITNRILQLAQEGCQVVGICGGFQMLGHKISDPLRLESSQKSIEGLKLLDISTEMAAEKTLRQVKLDNHVEGYEIHHGKTFVGNSEVIMSSGEEILGVRNSHVWGTYLHGIFDNDIYRLKFLNKLRGAKGLPLKDNPTIYNLEPAFDRLAKTVRENVDMDYIYQIMGL